MGRRRSRDNKTKSSAAMGASVVRDATMKEKVPETATPLAKRPEGPVERLFEAAAGAPEVFSAASKEDSARKEVCCGHFLKLLGQRDLGAKSQVEDLSKEAVSNFKMEAKQAAAIMLAAAEVPVPESGPSSRQHSRTPSAFEEAQQEAGVDQDSDGLAEAIAAAEAVSGGTAAPRAAETLATEDSSHGLTETIVGVEAVSCGTGARRAAETPATEDSSHGLAETIVPDVAEAGAPVVECGDLVVLGDRVPQEYRACPAVVTKVAESHCTVAVLDERRQFGIGECWPAFHDISLESCSLRLGTHVIVDGMGGSKTKHLNGLTGCIAKHPREGHPSFIRKPSNPDKPQLTVCICFDDASASKVRSALLEPRFITSFEEVALRKARELEETMAMCAALSPQSAV